MSTSTATTAPGSGASHQTGWTALIAELIDWSHAWSAAQTDGPGDEPRVGGPAVASAKLGTTTNQALMSANRSTGLY